MEVLQSHALKNGREIDFILDQRTALEAKETPTIDDETAVNAVAKVAGIKKYYLVGRHASPKFNNYIWGGSIH